uniref:Uncharacterized protein n=1 Tax=Schmidtea mediterranea TaxID=79327 RepID=A0A1S6KMK0_SCHMD|nr:hypothetical protein 13735 [Schmidtea mediterranea]
MKCYKNNPDIKNVSCEFFFCFFFYFGFNYKL